MRIVAAKFRSMLRGPTEISTNLLVQKFVNTYKHAAIHRIAFESRV